MARHDMTLRIFRILHYLEMNRQGLKVSEIHQRLKDDEFDVDIRTVHRDIELLGQAHIPLATEGSGPESRWHLAPFAEISRSIRFTYHEIFSLYVARKSLHHLRGTPLFSALDSVFLKLEKLLGVDHEIFESLSENLSFQPQITWHTSVQPELLKTVYDALESGHPLRAKYRAEAGDQAGVAAERSLGPECLYFANGSVYLIAVDLAKNEPRTYALARFEEVEILIKTKYEKRGHSPVKLFEESFGIFSQGDVEPVEILVTGPTAKYFSERRWHKSQTSRNVDTGVLFSYELKINDELVRFVLSMGPAAKVLKPESLRVAVQAAAAHILELYGRKAS